MQGSHTLYDRVALDGRRARGVSNMAIYASIGIFLLTFWLTVAAIVL